MNKSKKDALFWASLALVLLLVGQLLNAESVEIQAEFPRPESLRGNTDFYCHCKFLKLLNIETLEVSYSIRGMVIWTDRPRWVDNIKIYPVVPERKTVVKVCNEWFDFIEYEYLEDMNTVSIAELIR